jgi:hypothetical protein
MQHPITITTMETKRMIANLRAGPVCSKRRHLPLRVPNLKYPLQGKTSFSPLKSLLRLRLPKRKGL